MLKSVFLCSLLLVVQYSHALGDASRYQFACDLSQEILLSKINKNVCVSPASIQSCLTLAYIGAEGKTASQLRMALYLEQFPKKVDVAKDYADFLTLATKQRDSKLQIANRIYVGEEYEVVPQFNEVATRFFDSKAEVVNFGKSEQTTKKINTWVEEATHHKIKDLVSAGSLTIDTAAVLVNAIYFKAEWQNQFKPAQTKNLPFKVSESETLSVPTMRRVDVPVGFAEVPELDSTAVELPYQGTDLKMLILLPNKVNGLQELEQKLNQGTLLGLKQRLTNDVVYVSLPKFKIEFGLSLIENLKHLGLTSLFDSSADFSSLVHTNKQLYVSEVKHKAFINVDEYGSEAAAATYLEETYRSARENGREVHVDHPFVFAIKDYHAIYFLGHVVRP